jgi:hypothetical protein
MELGEDGEYLMFSLSYGSYLSIGVSGMLLLAALYLKLAPGWGFNRPIQIGWAGLIVTLSLIAVLVMGVMTASGAG